MQESFPGTGYDSIIFRLVVGFCYQHGKVVVLLMTAETYLRRGRRLLRRWLENPGLRQGLWAGAYGLAGFLLSAASIRHSMQPVAMGVICAMSGWQAVVMTLGSMLGYRFFWGQAGIQGAVWSAAGGMLALLVGKKKTFQEQTLLVSMLAAAMTASLGLVFQVVYREKTSLTAYFIRILLAGAVTALANQVLHHRDSVTDWLAGGLICLALAQVVPIPFFGLGYIAGAVVSVTGPFPAAAMAGLGLDLAQITRVPMTAVMCMAFLLRLIPALPRWVRYCTPGAACLTLMALSGQWDPMPLPGLILGGGVGMLIPAGRDTVYRRGPTGVAQVRLELTAGVLRSMQQILLEQSEPPIDREALLEKARLRACSGCSFQKSCQIQKKLGRVLLQNPLDVTCRKTGRLVGELQRSQEQLRVMLLERSRREEFRGALLQQLRFLSQYLQQLADQMPRRGQRLRASYTIEVSARSHGKHQANGDRCLAFSGIGCRYYVLLCDGMGTGLGASEEGRIAGNLIHRMLGAGLPPSYALQSMNSLLTLRGQAGAVTVDLAEIRLDTGKAVLYKWGAAPSWLLKSTGAQKIGTATPPPGISLSETREAVMRLSLSRGEVLILLSDGVDGEAALRRMEWAPDAPPGELAEKLLEKGRGKTEDDATAAVLRLRPAAP